MSEIPMADVATLTPNLPRPVHPPAFHDGNVIGAGTLHLVRDA
jgi:hypothetical protein